MLGPEQHAPHSRLDPVRAHQHVDPGTRAVIEPGLDPVAVIGQAGEPVPQVHPLGGHRAGQRGQQIGTMHLVVRKAEGGLQTLAERAAQQSTAVIPPALVERQRLHARLRQFPRQPQPVQHA
jgi:hypothetical protein